MSKKKAPRKPGDPGTEKDLKNAKAVLREFKIPKKIVDVLPEDSVIELAKSLDSKAEIDRETANIVAEIQKLAAAVNVARAEESEKKEAHKAAKERLEAALNNEHAAAERLEAVTKPGFQNTLPLKPAEESPKEPGKKDKAEKAPAGEPQEGPDLPEALIEEAVEIIEQMRRSKKQKGLGATSMAKRLFGSSSKDLKARAAQVLEALEQTGQVVRVQGSNKEASFWPSEAQGGDQVDPGPETAPKPTEVF